MAEWRIEEGIGETRALLIEGDAVRAAALSWPGELRAGEARMAQLSTKPAGARRGLATLENGANVLVDHLPQEITQGARFALSITRAPVAERGRFKQAHGRYLADTLPKEAAQPGPAFPMGAYMPAFEAGLWEEVWHAASSGSLAFSGGEIVCSATPAMTVIDVDGQGSPREVALAAIPAIARALRWFGVGGNIGIDFPTMEAKADRRALDEALAAELNGWPHERTAINGFGFVQLVARLEGPSLLQRFATSRVALCARYALRVAERAQGTGPVLLLGVHPALKAKLKPQWIGDLAQRTGRVVRIETDPGLALEAPRAQIAAS